MRGLLREQAGKGRAVLVSSHLLAEVAQSVDDVVIISHGELRGQGTLEQVLAAARAGTEVRTPDPERLAQALERRGYTVEREGDVLHVLGASAEQVGPIAGKSRSRSSASHPRCARSKQPSSRSRMTDREALLRAELIKLRTTRTFVVLTAAALALSLLVVVLSATLGNRWTEDDVRNLFFADFTGLFILLLGVMGMAGEWRHRTITSTVLAAPRRLRLLSAKTISYAVAGVAISLIVTVSIMAVGTLILSARDLPTVGLGDLTDVLWRNLVVAAYQALRGLHRRARPEPDRGHRRTAPPGLRGRAGGHRAGGRSGQVRTDVGRTERLSRAEDVFGEGDEQLTPAVALPVMIGWVGLAFAAAAARLERRDLVSNPLPEPALACLSRGFALNHPARRPLGTGGSGNRTRARFQPALSSR